MRDTDVLPDPMRRKLVNPDRIMPMLRPCRTRCGLYVPSVVNRAGCSTCLSAKVRCEWKRGTCDLQVMSYDVDAIMLR